MPTSHEIYASRYERNAEEVINMERMQGACDCCGYETEVKEYESGMPREKANLCIVCAGSFIGNQGYFYLEPNSNLYRSLGNVTNRVLDAIEDLKIDKAKLSERKTVHLWLNNVGIPAEEEGKPICLLRRISIAVDFIHRKGGYDRK
jgi:hypothetical protein